VEDDFAAAVDELYGAPFAKFVDERKRLAAELKAAGNKLPAQRLAAIARPPVSVWAINQLWRQARDEMDALFAAAAKVRGGDLEATAIHREVLNDLRARATEILKADGNAAGEPTLRRIAQTLQALAAAGTWEPDAPGRLTTDRDPPGFEALAGLVGAAPKHPVPARAVDKPARAPSVKVAPGEDAAEVRAAAAKAKADAEAAAKARATRRRELEVQARAAERQVEQATRELESARAAVALAAERVARAETAVAEAQARAGEATGALDDFDAAIADSNPG
jgi:hypothetical protein